MRRREIALGAGVAALFAAGAIVALSDASTPTRSAGNVENGIGHFAPTTTPFAAGVGGDARLLSGKPATPAAKAAGGNLSAVSAAAASAPAAARIVKTATITVSVGNDGVAKTADAAASIAEREAGFVAESQRTTGDDRSATLTLRVPAARFDAVMKELRGLGRVKDESIGGTDVTGQLVDLDARLRSLRAQEDALNALLARANTVGETLQVAQAAGDIRTQIEQLAAQQAQLSDSADLATIRLAVVGPHAAVNQPSKPSPLLVRSFERAAAGALAVLGGTIVVVGYVVPLGLLAGAVTLGWRGLTRRRRPKVAVA